MLSDKLSSSRVPLRQYGGAEVYIVKSSPKMRRSMDRLISPKNYSVSRSSSATRRSPSAERPNSPRNVHFSPIVNSVNWRESFIEPDEPKMIKVIMDDLNMRENVEIMDCAFLEKAGIQERPNFVRSTSLPLSLISNTAPRNTVKTSKKNNDPQKGFFERFSLGRFSHKDTLKKAKSLSDNDINKIKTVKLDNSKSEKKKFNFFNFGRRKKYSLAKNSEAEISDLEVSETAGKNISLISSTNKTELPYLSECYSLPLSTIEASHNTSVSQNDLTKSQKLLPPNAEYSIKAPHDDIHDSAIYSKNFGLESPVFSENNIDETYGVKPTLIPETDSKEGLTALTKDYSAKPAFYGENSFKKEQDGIVNSRSLEMHAAKAKFLPSNDVQTDASLNSIYSVESLPYIYHRPPLPPSSHRSNESSVDVLNEIFEKYKRDVISSAQDIISLRQNIDSPLKEKYFKKVSNNSEVRCSASKAVTTETEIEGELGDCKITDPKKSLSFIGNLDSCLDSFSFNSRLYKSINNNSASHVKASSVENYVPPSRISEVDKYNKYFYFDGEKTINRENTKQCLDINLQQKNEDKEVQKTPNNNCSEFKSIPTNRKRAVSVGSQRLSEISHGNNSSVYLNQNSTDFEKDILPASSCDSVKVTSSPVITKQSGQCVAKTSQDGEFAVKSTSSLIDDLQLQDSVPNISKHIHLNYVETNLDNLNFRETSLDEFIGNCTKFASTFYDKKAKSMLNLDGFSVPLKPIEIPGQVDSRAKSVEYLLDGDTKSELKTPENDLQRISDRQPSEYEQRVQRSLQKLNVPEWYKPTQFKINNPGCKPPLRWSDMRRSYTSLDRNNWQNFKSSREKMSPSSTASVYNYSISSRSDLNLPADSNSIRFGSSRFARTRDSSFTSQSGDVNFNRYSSGRVTPLDRSPLSISKPYLGWRSREALNLQTTYKTPSERLAESFQSKKDSLSSKNEVETSLHEVASAIQNYTKIPDSSLIPSKIGLNSRLVIGNGDKLRESKISPRKQRLWVESSFLGSSTMNEADSTKKTKEETIDFIQKQSDEILIA